MPHDDAIALIDRDAGEFSAMRHAVALARLMSAELEAGSTDILRRIDDAIDCQRQIGGSGVPGRTDPRSASERDLRLALNLARKTVADAVAEGDVDRAAHALAALRPLVAAFFAKGGRK